MSTTTIRLPDDLKARVARMAKRSGKSAHAFIVDAIVEKTDADERRSEFLDVADRRYAEVSASGKAIPWNDMRRYIEARAAGGRPRRPVAKKLAP